MATRVRSYAKINLGLAIGPPRPDGFHGLCTLYQTLAVHDFVTVTATPATRTSLVLTSNDRRVPTDGRNTAWKMVERALASAGVLAAVELHIEKRLPIQGGMGAGSANAAAALLGLERELSLDLPAAERLRIAAEVGSDVPLFLIGGAVLGTDRGQVVEAVPDLDYDGTDQVACVIALPETGVSTPLAFREWDRRWFAAEADPDLQKFARHDTIGKLSRAYASCFPQAQGLGGAETTQIQADGVLLSAPPENLQDLSGEQHHPLQVIESKGRSAPQRTSLLKLIRSASEIDGPVAETIRNDFESVVFPQNQTLEPIKQMLMGSEGEPGQALYAALSGSGSALFGLYRSDAEARTAQQRLQQHGVKALVTRTLPRPLYWSEMFAE